MLRAAIFVALFGLFGLCASRTQDWFQLRTKWGAVPGIQHNFEQQPRTAAEAEKSGWLQISSCEDGDTQFPGHRYIRSKRDKDLVLIFDENGFIAGVQNIVPVRMINEDATPYQFDSVPVYQPAELMGEQVYYTTAYFVEPASICQGGRTQEEFDQQGTGYLLAFQNGPRADVDYFLAPLTMDEAQITDGWYEHFCFFNMGYHFLTIDQSGTDECIDKDPLQIVFHNGKINGFVFQHFTKLEGRRWEFPIASGLPGIIDHVPQCANDLANQGQLTSQHVYFGDYVVSC